MDDRHDRASDLDRSAALHGRPTVVELLIAAREFLSNEVFPATEGSVQFHTRVTIRILDTVVRELEMGLEQVEQHSEVLARLGYESDQQLVEAIRAGRHDRGISELASALEPVARAKLEVANPKYLG